MATPQSNVTLQGIDRLASSDSWRGQGGVDSVVWVGAERAYLRETRRQVTDSAAQDRRNTPAGDRNVYVDRVLIIMPPLAADIQVGDTATFSRDRGALETATVQAVQVIDAAEVPKRAHTMRLTLEPA